MKTQVIIPAAGTGIRLKSEVAKPLIPLNGKPLLVYSLEVFEKCSLVESIIVVGPEQYLSDFERVVQQYNFEKVSSVIAGGVTRCESVSCGLKALDKDTELVVVHDGARPLISLAIVEKAIQLCTREHAVIVAVPVKPTVKRVNPEDLCVEATLERRFLWEAQTPQVFRKDVLIKAHDTIKDSEVTDDASLVERLGEKVKVLEGDYTNIKITTQEDLRIAESFLAEEEVKI